jgi:uncharacterized membrane protein YgaE (UPF0421/DUF939 family)
MSSREFWRDRGAALGPRAARHSKASVQRRLGRLRARFFFIAQCSLAAAAAWWVGETVFHHPAPFFAPVTAMICLGLTFGQRLRRVVEVTVGVAVGVFVGDVFVHFFGSGVWQIAVVAALAMSIAVLLGAGFLIVTQAGVQSVIVMTLLPQPGAAFSRWVDALIGGGIALLATTIAPAAPLRRPRQQAARVVAELAAILDDTAQALSTRNPELASAALERARASESALDELRSLSAEGIAVVRLSPFRRGHQPGVQAIADLVEPLDRAIRNVRVLVRRAAVAVWRSEEVPEQYVDLVASLAEVTLHIAAELDQRRLPVAARDELAALGRASAAVAPQPSLSAEVIRAQVRSTVVDLLMLTGLTYDEARNRVPASVDALEDDFVEGEH